MNPNNNHKTINLPWGKGETINFTTPAGWNILDILSPLELEPLLDVEKKLDSILRNPIDSLPLLKIAEGKKDVVIVVDDISRPTPVHTLIGKILEHLETGGITKDLITVIPALGVHRPMTREEMENKIGKENLKHLKWENHDCKNLDKLTYIGRTKRGTKIIINKKVANADLLIMVGTIEPHIHAGFGGD